MEKKCPDNLLQEINGVYNEKDFFLFLKETPDFYEELQHLNYLEIGEIIPFLIGQPSENPKLRPLEEREKFK